MPTTPGPALVVAASTAYAANCALGAAVAARVVDTRRHRWVHHALYVVTGSLTVAAVLTAAGRPSVAGVLLAPALLPLAVLPRAGRARHAAIALAAAPWYAGALLTRRG